MNDAFAKKQPGQVLATTLIVLMIVSIAIFGIVTTVIRNTEQIFTNAQYQRAYNTAESRILQNIEYLGSLDLSGTLTPVANEIENTGPIEDIDSCSEDGDTITCGIDEPDGSRTIFNLEDTPLVENYQLNEGEFFEMLLDNRQLTFQIEWGVENTALDLELIYVDQNDNELKAVRQVFDPSGNVFQINPADSSYEGFAGDNTDLAATSLKLDLESPWNQLGGGSNDYDFQKLRIRLIHPEDRGRSFSIIPVEAESTGNLPDQARKIEAVNVSTDLPENAAPVVVTYIPLSPATPSLSTFALNFDTLDPGAFCGNGLLEGSENCDFDDPNDPNASICRDNTAGSNACSFCGDGDFDEPIETCDIGISSGAGFASNCRPASVSGACTYCGDNTVNGNETCDGQAGCRSNCTQCGDNVINDPSETCDGSANGITNCRGDCTYCGDGIVQAEHGEECEYDGEDDCVQSTCQRPDGFDDGGGSGGGDNDCAVQGFNCCKDGGPPYDCEPGGPWDDTCSYDENNPSNPHALCSPTEHKCPASHPNSVPACN